MSSASNSMKVLSMTFVQNDTSSSSSSSSDKQKLNESIREANHHQTISIYDNNNNNNNRTRGKDNNKIMRSLRPTMGHTTTVYCCYLAALSLIILSAALSQHAGCDAAALVSSNSTKAARTTTSIHRDRGCYYMLQHYKNGETIKTDEPCLNCTCENSMLMCYLRVCPYVKPMGDRCIVERVPGECCPKITCSDVLPPGDGIEQQVEPETLAPLSASSSSPETIGSTKNNGSTPLDTNNNFDIALTNASEVEAGAGGCMLAGSFYHEGAQLPSDPKKPCEICYCINNSSACVLQECALEVSGCAPIYQAGGCCPTRYNCTTTGGGGGSPAAGQRRASPAANRRKFWDSFGAGYSTSATPPPASSRLPPAAAQEVLSFSTTAKPMALPDFSREAQRPTVSGCRASSNSSSSTRIFADGERVPSRNKCEHCYCMRNEIVCAVQECRPPCDGCVPIYEDDKDCCPKRYECAAPTQRVPTDNILSEAQSETTTPLSPADNMASATVNLEITSTTGPPTEASSAGADTNGYSPTGGSQSSTASQPESADHSTPAPALVVVSVPSSQDSSAGKLEPVSVMTTRQTNSPPLRPISPKLSSGDEDSSAAEPMAADQESTNNAGSKPPESRDSSASVDGFSLNGEREQEADQLNKSAGRFVAPEGAPLIPAYANQGQEANELIPAALTSTIAPPSTVMRDPGSSQGEHAFANNTTTNTNTNTSPAEVQNGDRRVRPQVIPSAIPGEGSCRYNGRLYSNGQEVKSKDTCMEICMCINSVVYCDEVDCPKGPESQENCKRVIVEGECCPKYICDEPVNETNPPSAVTDATEAPASSPKPAEQPAETSATVATIPVGSQSNNPTETAATTTQPEGTSTSTAASSSFGNQNKTEEPIASSEAPAIGSASTEQSPVDAPATTTPQIAPTLENETTGNFETSNVIRGNDVSSTTTTSTPTTTTNDSIVSPSSQSEPESANETVKLDAASTISSGTSTSAPPTTTDSSSIKSGVEPSSSSDTARDGAASTGVGLSTTGSAPASSDMPSEAAKRGEEVIAPALDQTSGVPGAELEAGTNLQQASSNDTAASSEAPMSPLPVDPTMASSVPDLSDTTTSGGSASSEPATVAATSPVPVSVGDSSSSSSPATMQDFTTTTAASEPSSSTVSADPTVGQPAEAEAPKMAETDPSASGSQPGSSSPSAATVETTTIPPSPPVVSTEGTTVQAGITNSESSSSTAQANTEVPTSSSQDAGSSTISVAITRPIEPVETTSKAPELAASSPEVASEPSVIVDETTSASAATVIPVDKAPEQIGTQMHSAVAQEPKAVDASAQSENVEHTANGSPVSPIGNEVMRVQTSSETPDAPVTTGVATSTVQPANEEPAATVEVAKAEPNFEPSTTTTTTTMSPAEVRATASPADEFLASISSINGTSFKPVEITTVIPSIRGQSTPITIPWSHIANNSQPEPPVSSQTTETPAAPAQEPVSTSLSFGGNTSATGGLATKTISHQEPTQSSIGVSSESDYESELSEETGCEYEGKTYNSAQQIPRSHPCDFCFCFRGDIICLQQTCPPPVPHCFESVMDGFCCPRYECPVHTLRSMPNSTSLSLTPFESHSQLQQPSPVSANLEQLQESPNRTTMASRPNSISSSIRGCFVDNKLYGVGQEIVSASSPCLECRCDKSGMMKCNPKECTPEDQLLQQINRDVLQSTLSRSQAR